MDLKWIGEQYQETSKYSRGKIGGARWTEDTDPGTYKIYPDALRVVELPEPKFVAGDSLWDAMRERRSIRRYSNQPISLVELSNLIWSFAGITKETAHYILRTAPSAGALYPIETYLVVNNIAGLEQGVYHHDVRRFALEMLKKGKFGEKTADACLGQNMCETAAVVFIWTAVVPRCRSKYHERAYRYIYMDAGHIGQNVYLAATAMNFGCCGIGAFYDDEVNAIVDADGKIETAVYLATVGKK
ncbi:MAG: SagB/ThcOx family dehydrogenase [bacterium]